MWGDYVSLCGEAVNGINPPRQRGLITGYYTQVRELAGCWLIRICRVPVAGIAEGMKYL